MPGVRLGRQERRQIALGVAAGLSCAEIARGLGRPASTVTREVRRNGGPAAYRADRAQLAAERRARRPRGSAPRGSAQAQAQAQAQGQGQGRDDGAVRAYGEELAALLLHQGLPGMAARVLACLLTTDAGSLTASELALRLRVSPASVSKAVAFLDGHGFVRRERDGRRRERYVLDDGVWHRSAIAGAHGVALVAATVRRGVGVLGPGSPAAARLEGIARLGDVVGGSILRAAEQARDALRAAPGAPTG
ncbi:helix-turn-helix domain-containing protein [Kitasatospora sp. NBC_01560]|uniref:helix-turn-helix domain-containing protein n=1 Tax=Kitasatospora sp. NBC_01560 TaxID=2975965 RepID=UPI0038671F38